MRQPFRCRRSCPGLIKPQRIENSQLDTYLICLLTSLRRDRRSGPSHECKGGLHVKQIGTMGANVINTLLAPQ